MVPARRLGPNSNQTGVKVGARRYRGVAAPRSPKSGRRKITKIDGPPRSVCPFLSRL